LSLSPYQAQSYFLPSESNQPRGLSKHTPGTSEVSLGDGLRCSEANINGTSDFNLEGLVVGAGVGGELGDTDRVCVGCIDGASDFNLEGLVDGAGMGGELGDTDRVCVSHMDGASDFNLEGLVDGARVGVEVGYMDIWIYGWSFRGPNRWGIRLQLGRTG
jgi:hypothetical protein